MDAVSFYRQQAALARRLSANALNLALERELANVASYFEKLADDLEREVLESTQ
jgi:hypothetical protein